MDFPSIPGLDRGAAVAAFAGAVAYLVTQDKMKPARAFGYVLVGGMAAAYIGPAICEFLSDHYKLVVGEKSRGAVIFMTGVGGIWIIHIITAVLEAFKQRAGSFVEKFLDRIFGNKTPPPSGGQ